MQQEQSINIEIIAIEADRAIVLDVGYFGADWRRHLPYVEDKGYETYWDKAGEQWVMSPKETKQCPVCRGYGTLHQAYQDESGCWGCHGSGEADTVTDKSKVITCVDFLAEKHQRQKIQLRYGQEDPVSVREYWTSSDSSSNHNDPKKGEL